MRKSTILAVSLLILFPLISSAAYEISDGSVKALWHFEDTVDSSGNGHNLTNNGTVTFPAAKLSNGAQSNGSNSLSVNSNLGIDGGTFMLNIWVKNATTFDAAGEHIFMQQSANTDTSYAILGYDSGGTKHLVFRRERVGTTNCQVDVAYTLTAGTWYFLSITYAGTTLEGYVNNVSQGTQTCSGNGTGASDKTELFAKNGGEFWTGTLDEGVVQNSVSTSTIAALYNSGNGQEVCTAVGCASGTSTSTSSSTTPMQENFFEYGTWLLRILLVLGSAAVTYKLITGRKLP